MPQFQITFTVPEGTTISINGLDGTATVDAAHDDAIDEYWKDYLSENARKVYGAAARIESIHGPGYTLEDIAQTLNLDYASVRSIHRTSGRTAKVWREEMHTDEPIRLIDCDYEWDEVHEGMRTTYQLPPGVAAAIEHAPSSIDGPVKVVSP